MKIIIIIIIINKKSSYGEFANQITRNKEREWRRNVSSMPLRAARNILLS